MSRHKQDIANADLAHESRAEELTQQLSQLQVRSQLHALHRHHLNVHPHSDLDATRVLVLGSKRCATQQAWLPA